MKTTPAQPAYLSAHSPRRHTGGGLTSSPTQSTAVSDLVVDDVTAAVLEQETVYDPFVGGGTTPPEPHRGATYGRDCEYSCTDGARAGALRAGVEARTRPGRPGGLGS